VNASWTEEHLKAQRLLCYEMSVTLLLAQHADQTCGMQKALSFIRSESDIPRGGLSFAVLLPCKMPTVAAASTSPRKCRRNVDRPVHYC